VPALAALPPRVAIMIGLLFGEAFCNNPGAPTSS
jgi:hypothetical protein